MKYIIGVVVVVALIIGGVKYLGQGATAMRAEKRVETMMENWRKGGTGTDGYAQEAICLWFDGTRTPQDSATLSAASDDFDEWRREKDLYRSISSYSIVRSEVFEEAGEPYPEVHVYVSIDGETYGMKVTPGVSITWLDQD